jgi:phosphohistidine phosphatase
MFAEHGGGGGATALHGHSVAVVGHEPWLGELIGWLTAGDPRAGEALVIKKGSVSWLEGSAVPGGMSLRALLPPRVLRALRE